jgi:hypothetical protein
MNVPSDFVDVVEAEDFFKSFSKVLSKPQYRHFYRIIFAMMICLRAHRITDVVRLWNYACHWTNAYYFVRSKAWEPTKLIGVLWELLVKVVSGRVFIVADDTTVRHAGAKKMECVSRQHNASAQNDPCRPQKIWGHKWVVMGVALMLTSLNWEIAPLMSCLVEKGISKLQICLDMLKMLGPSSSLILTLVADGWYTKRPLVQGLKGMNIFYLGKIRRTARVYEPLDETAPRPKGKRGPKPKKGKRIILSELAKLILPSLCDAQVTIRGKKITVDIWEKIVVVAGWRGLKARYVLARRKLKSGRYTYLNLICTDLSLNAVEIINYYDCRWMIEPCFCDLKQKGGFADYSGRKARGHNAWAQLCCVARTLLLLIILKTRTGFKDPWRRSTQPNYITVGQKRLEFAAKLFHLGSLDLNDSNSHDSTKSVFQRTKIR